MNARQRDDGVIRKLMDEYWLPLVRNLIDIGVDILNPVQVSSPGMDTARLKHEYGRC